MRRSSESDRITRKGEPMRQSCRIVKKISFRSASVFRFEVGSDRSKGADSSALVPIGAGIVADVAWTWAGSLDENALVSITLGF